MRESVIYQSVQKNYDQGAAAFSKRRQHPWPHLNFIKKYFKKNQRLLDFGCGNGRLIDFLKIAPSNYLGLDISSNLIKIAKKKHPGYQFQVADLGAAPKSELPPAFFDIVMSIAVFHHFPPGPRRLTILKKLRKTLAPGGLLLLTAWNLNQPQYHRYFHSDKKSAFIPFKNPEGQIIFKRYCYRWDLPELKEFIEKAGFEVIKAGFAQDRGQKVNLYCVARKT